jgi:hypothetical protein
VVAGAVEARRPCGRPVLQERAEAEDLGQQQPRQRQAGKRLRAEVADDRGVAQDVERLCHERAQGGEREGQHLAVGGHPRIHGA